jgi:hypothetical protein
MKVADVRTRERVKKITVALKGRDMNQWEIADHIALQRNSVRGYITYFLNNDLAHVVDWTRGGNDGPYIPVLRSGPGKSVPKPAAKTGAHRKADSYARLKKDPERYERYLMGQRVLRRKPPMPDELLSWMFQK